MANKKHTAPEVKPAPTKTLHIRGVDPMMIRAMKMLAASSGETQARTLTRLIDFYVGTNEIAVRR
jgi:hypothetical protein